MLICTAKMPEAVILRFHPPQGCAGSITRYYHFLFDQLWPCFELFNSGQLERSTPVFIENLGPFVGILPVALDWNIELFDPREGPPEGVPILDVIGKNPKCCRFSAPESHAFAEHLFRAFEVPDSADGPRVLMIERGPPNPFFLSDDSPSKTGGITRRGIVNHDQLSAALEGVYGADFLNVQLERTPFAEQLRLFRSADLVIAQHGGGLANALWMKPGRRLVEIRSRHQAFRHFKKLARYHRLGYSVYHVQSHHPVVEPRALLRFLRWRFLL